MPFDKQWDAFHAARSWGKYPDEHLVRAFARRYPLLEPDEKRWPRPLVIDLGCGAGAQSIFLAKEGCSVLAVDGSREALSRLITRSEDQDLAHLINPFHSCLAALDTRDCGFDLAVDICTLQHLPVTEAKAVIVKVKNMMNPDGLFFSLMADEAHTDDPNAPQFRRVDYAGIRDLFPIHDWDIKADYVMRSRGDGAHVAAHHIIEATVPK